MGLTGNFESIFERIETLSTCDLSDAMQSLGLATGFLPDIILFSPKMVGPSFRVAGLAHTVQMVHFNDSSAPPTPPQHHVDSAQPGNIIVIATPKDSINAVWGGIMTARAKVLGVKGVVIDGRCRDLEEHWEEQFPVFAKGRSCLSATHHTRVSTVMSSITIHGVTIHPGDVMVADIDGVVCIPKSEVEVVMKKAEARAFTDQLCKNAIQNGSSIKHAFATYR